MKVKMLHKMPASLKAPPGAVRMDSGGNQWIESGVELETPNAWKLVIHGCAECADEECEEQVSKHPSSVRGVMYREHQRIMREQADYQDEQAAELEDEDNNE